MTPVSDLILHEDNHLLFAFKPARLLTQGDATGDPSLLDLLKAWIKQRDHKPGRVFLGLVHRLDRPVSGVVVFARTSKAAARLAAQFRDHRVTKVYQAVVQGRVEPPEGTLVHFHTVGESTVAIHDQPAEGRKEARLSYHVLDQVDGVSVVEILLATGRKHQIRAQFAHVGHPILGDHRYGPRSARPSPILLVAKRLTVWHPTRPDLAVMAEVPIDLCPIERWRRQPQ